MKNKLINGEQSDEYVKERLVSYAQNLSPIRTTDGYLAYASLLLNWIIEGDREVRVARTTAIQKAHAARLGLPSDAWPMAYPEFIAEAGKIAEFLS